MEARKVVLVNPSVATAGYSFFTPRWLFVLAGATPSRLIGEPLLVDEAITRFRPEILRPGDVVGIGVSSGNCIPAYRVLAEAKRRGAIAVVGGVHPTLFPEEPLERGADAVVTGNGDLVWSRVVEDALAGRLQKKYDGGRIPGELMVKARWDLLDPTRYLFPTIQTVAGCPERCSFCSVWVTDGRKPRQRLASMVIEEARELYALGYRYLAFADDNFNPATLGRIVRETSASRREELERVREERLSFFEEYDRAVPKDIFGITQMTSEIVSDPEYLTAMVRKARIRAALIGVESFSAEGLATAGKDWNPAGEKMVDTIREIQDQGILVLTSLICGLESDTKETLSSMRRFACESGASLAQFTFYSPYSGTVDYHEMVRDLRTRVEPGFTPKRKLELLQDRFWLTPLSPADYLRHPNFTREQILVENQKCWDLFYSLKEIARRTRGPFLRSQPLVARLAYALACLAFKRVYAGHGVSADSVRRRKLGLVTRLIIRLGLRAYGWFFRRPIHLDVSFLPARLPEHELTDT